jgi:hypothetical protein
MIFCTEIIPILEKSEFSNFSMDEQLSDDDIRSWGGGTRNLDDFSIVNDVWGSRILCGATFDVFDITFRLSCFVFNFGYADGLTKVYNIGFKIFENIATIVVKICATRDVRLLSDSRTSIHDTTIRGVQQTRKDTTMQIVISVTLLNRLSFDSPKCCSVPLLRT